MSSAYIGEVNWILIGCWSLIVAYVLALIAAIVLNIIEGIREPEYLPNVLNVPFRPSLPTNPIDNIAVLDHHVSTYHSRGSLEICSICQEDLGTSENVVQLSCQHVSHDRYLRRWLRDVCPYCQRPTGLVKKSTLGRISLKGKCIVKKQG